ncbi:MAG: leucyl aminopeptidase family protein, partial [Pseudomonadota bacterium]
MTAKDFGFLPHDPEKADQATKLWVVTKEAASAALEAHHATKLAHLSGFEGELGTILPTEEGVFVGAGDGEDGLMLGSAAAKLPKGDYVLRGHPAGVDPTLMAMGWAMGAYRYDHYKTMPEVPTLILNEDVDQAALKRHIEAVHLVRDLVNTPAEDMGPDALERAAREVAAQQGATVEVIEGEALEEGFPLIHAVGRAASQAPRLVDIRWGPSDGRPVTLVGKGVCFDS